MATFEMFPTHFFVVGGEKRERATNYGRNKMIIINGNKAEPENFAQS